MKSIFLKVCLILFFASTGLIYAQDLKTVVLDEDNANLVNPSPRLLVGGNLLQFKTINGDFAILIIDAYKFLDDLDEANLEIWVTSSNPESDQYEVLKDLEPGMVIHYTVYSISNDEWPDAPPRIIVVR